MIKATAPSRAVPVEKMMRKPVPAPAAPRDFREIAQRSAEAGIADELNRAYEAEAGAKIEEHRKADRRRDGTGASAVAEIQRTSLVGKRVLLTGGTTGIGRATVLQLAAAGARVLTFGRHEAALHDMLAEAEGKVIGLTADVTSPAHLDAVFAEVDGQFGGIDILVCNAALGADPIHEMEENEWRYVIETNLIGYLACAKAALERMRRDGQGHILFVSSISVEIKAVGESVYAATKAGIEAFAETLRKEMAEENIKISVVQPGSVRTDMQECSEADKRQAVANDEMLEPEEIADAILFVLTRSARADVLNLRIEPRLQKTS